MSVHSWWSPKTENIKGVRPYLSLFHSVIFSIKPTLILLIFFTRNVGEKKTCHIVLQQKLIFFSSFLPIYILNSIACFFSLCFFTIIISPHGLDNFDFSRDKVIEKISHNALCQWQTCQNSLT